MGGAEHAQTFNFWRIKAMKLLKILCLFFLLGSDFQLKPASLEAKIQSQCSSKRIKGKQGVTDKSAKFGPPEKNEHITTPLLDSDDDFELPPPSKEVKEDDGEKKESS